MNRHHALSDEASRLFELTTESRQSSLACGYIVPLVNNGVLRSHVEVAHASLQRRAFIDRTASRECEACVDDANAGGGDPYSALCALREERLVPQGSGERVAPMAGHLDLVKGARCPQFGGDTAELELEGFRFTHRDGGAELLPAGVGKREEIIHRSLGNADIEGAMQKRKKVRHGLVERSR